MKLEKAIEILHALTLDTRAILNPDDRDAIRLGIEALKRIHSDRVINPDLNPYPLPGETKE